jgi:hypothetical protein
MVLARRLVIVRSKRPTPEIRATGVIELCRKRINWLEESMG